MHLAEPIHPRTAPADALTDDERLRVAAFLEAATPVLLTTATDVDPLDPAAGAVVGLSVRSDGEWVWSDAHAYFVRAYGMAPQPDFLAYIRARGYVCDVIDAASAEQVVEEFGAMTQ